MANQKTVASEEEEKVVVEKGIELTGTGYGVSVACVFTSACIISISARKAQERMPSVFNGNVGSSSSIAEEFAGVAIFSESVGQG
ncbi:hypothetical protein GLAREA_06282 [Glarea lozoyensis ATCC 20868]|uniref:Uncharacterized protein n=1 Tax=Glarea lozoyensis (strain ATCC 20868 / MF5171) TaxID=1116229 RepID=S3D6C5_GLAL2|nr:uncharacterized protein GLAREA_06282 [Glarea lozoyensis ATCC 20868]EPE33270.1 hypothetical protein GLAREA_06282 [Glarea lozoyensis ATCC 20868]